MIYLIYPQDNATINQIGGKASALAALSQTDLPIPAWFVLSPEAFAASLSASQRQVLTNATDTTQVKKLFKHLRLDPSIQAELEQALTGLCPNGELVAVRSSALDEDGSQHSLAGQLDSFLGVPPDRVAEKVVAVWRSTFDERALAYRRERGLSVMSHRASSSLTYKREDCLKARLLLPAILIQRMVEADVSGVAFSADPVSGRREVTVVSAVYGLGTALVSGEVDGDTYKVNRGGEIISWEVAVRPDVRHDVISFRNGQNRLITCSTTKTNQPVLSDPQILAVANLARGVEQFFGRPQDIEWAIEEGQLYLLQARPITTLAGMPDPDGVLNLWDNSNIAESYPGMTTPLTFSFARRAYEEVYRQFCRLMGVPETTIAEHHNTFRRMLGFMRGRIYYNLLSWFRVLALLPGYRFNRRFMEQMMGVKESLPDELLDVQTTPSRGDRLNDGLRLLRTLLGLIVNYFLLPRRIETFYQRLNRALGNSRPDLSRYRPDELAAYYRNLESQLLTRWDAPLVNDFFAMIFYGLLRKLGETWCGDTHGTLQNNLLVGSGGIVSAEPIRHIRRLAQFAAADPTFVTLLQKGTLPDILECMPSLPEFETAYQAYLDKFGDRCLEELKLESPTLRDDPLLLLRSVGRLVEQGSRGAGEQGSRGSSYQLPITDYHSNQAEEQIRAALARRPLRRLMFAWVLKNARRLIRNRENLRFERTRLFGRARMIFIEFGRKFYALDLLEQPRDIFYLEVEEILGFIDGTTTTTDLAGLVALRRTEFERYQSLDPPADRFETRGMVNQGNTFYGDEKVEIVDGDRRQGLGCSPGVVRGPVRLVTDPRRATLQPGEIMVAQRTDPGWVVLFPAAAGLLIEHGSLLSHSAIVSREMGLPAIVSLAGVTRWLKNGDWVEMDGRSGVVRKIEALRQRSLGEFRRT